MAVAEYINKLIIVNIIIIIIKKLIYAFNTIPSYVVITTNDLLEFGTQTISGSEHTFPLEEHAGTCQHISTLWVFIPITCLLYGW